MSKQDTESHYPDDNSISKDRIRKKTKMPDETHQNSVEPNTKQIIREKMQRLQARLLEQVDEKLTAMLGEVLHEVERNETKQHAFVAAEGNVKYKNRVKSGKDVCPDKQFLPRNSMLNELFEIKHFRTIYNIFIVILLIMFLNTAVYELASTGTLNLGFDLILWSFGGMRTLVVTWLGMMITTLAVYPCFYLWGNCRTRITNPLSRRCWDLAWLSVLLTYQTLFILLPARVLYLSEAMPSASISFLMEQVRLVMKSHAFVRSNIPRALASKAGHGKDKGPCPGFSLFLYFLFAPTLIYRDAYPRATRIRWSLVAWHLVEVVGCIFYTAFIFDRFLIPTFRDFGRRPLPTPDKLVVWFFGAMMPGTMCFLCGFFCLLHAWMNACAEMLTFSDRMFYKDWWNATSYADYYRTWNVVVHDWLYTYIYKDFSDSVHPTGRFIPTALVFVVSAVVHEYILALTFRFFYPALFFAFGGFGFFLVFVTRDRQSTGNILMWFFLCTGNGVLTSLYSIEWYARVNCPKLSDEDSGWDFFVPRSWFCEPAITL